MVSVISNSKLVSFLVFGVLVLNCFTGFGSYAKTLAPAEVEVLQLISSSPQLNWKISDTFTCDELQGFTRSDKDVSGIEINITCNCPDLQNDTVDRITTIWLKGLNLNGDLLPAFGNFTCLKDLDLTRNYINGSIPSSFGQLPLVILSLLGNRLSGAIPKEIGDIASLEELVLEDNQLDGPLDENLGNLRNLQRLVLSGNNCNGTIPESFGNLKNLTEFRISGTKISGKIPDFIGNWTMLDKLYIEGTSMKGPIPSNISLLTRLTQLMISDLNGSAMKFPYLKNLTNLKHLVLRNCLITDSIPDYIWDISKHNLRRLDLSFNRLNGSIPDISTENLNLQYMFLTNNSLSQVVPNWILNKRGKNLDISYNNFSYKKLSSDDNCEVQSLVNMVSIYSSLESNSSSWCFKKDFPCSGKPQNYELFINCGGNNMEYEGNEYQEDTDKDGPSYFRSYSERWAYSSTGIFNAEEDASYIAYNSSSLNGTIPAFYQTARLAPLSLKYYGLCLRNGSYKVKLHFAEIMFSNDQTFSSLGKRIFDVSIQGELRLKDFNIVEAAGGVGKNFSQEFNVTVTGSTLEIHLYWAGKGTNTIPQKGVYGPLISAIEVTPNFKVDTGGLSVGAIVGIVAASCLVLVFILVLLRMKGYLGGKQLEDNGHRKDYINEEWKEDLDLPVFDLNTIANVTDNFSSNNKLGQGGFGPVYKGTLIEGQEIAVKRLSKNSGQGLEEFKNEVILIAKLQHRNLVKLLGCCIEGDEKLLIYEFMPNKSLDFFIFDQTRRKLLDWHKRINIIGGIARGLLYLHQDSRLRIIHRDLKTSNILLDKDMNPKISDFGMARTFWGDQTEENTRRVVGTYGYMSPEYQIDGLFSVKSDVFSFGVIVLEIVSGRKNRGFYHQDNNLNLLGHAWRLWIEEKPLELLDSMLSGSFSLSEVLRCIHVGLLCVQQQPEDRPNMSTVVLMLGSDGILSSPKQPGFYTERNPQLVASSSSSKNKSSSTNEMSFTILDAR